MLEKEEIQLGGLNVLLGTRVLSLDISDIVIKGGRFVIDV